MATETFDPDTYLASVQQPQFDADVYLAQNQAQAFDPANPDKYVNAMQYLQARQATNEAQQATFGPTSILGGTIKAANELSTPVSETEPDPTPVPNAETGFAEQMGQFRSAAAASGPIIPELKTPDISETAPAFKIPRPSLETAGKIAKYVPGIQMIFPALFGQKTANVLDSAGINAISDTAEFLTSKLGLGMMTGGSAPRVLVKAATAIFLAKSIYDNPKLVQEIIDAPDDESRAQAISHFAQNLGISIGTGTHLAQKAPVIAKTLQDLAPKTSETIEPKPMGKPQTLDDLNLARAKLTEGMAGKSPEVQAVRQTVIDEIDNELLKYDRHQVSESAARIAEPAQSTPPEDQSTQGIAAIPSSEKSGTSSLFKQAQAEAAGQPTPVEEKEELTSNLESANSPLTANQNEKAILRPAPAQEQRNLGREGRDTQLPPAASVGDVHPRASGEDRDVSQGSAAQPAEGHGTERAVDPLAKLREQLSGIVDLPEPEIDHSKVAAMASKLPEGAANIVRKVLLGGMTVEEAAADSGMSVAKAQDIVDRSRRFLTTAKTVEPLARKRSYEDQPSAEGRKDAPEVEATKQRDEGMSEGPGAAAETERPPTSVTGIRNAIVDEQRVKQGLPPREPVMRRTYGPLWDEAMRAFDQDQEVGNKLVESLDKNSRPLTDLEDAILTHEQLDRQQNYDNAVDRVNHAETDAEQIAAQLQLDQAREAMFQIYDVEQKAGTANARGLAARRLLVREDYTLAKMEARKQAANGGEKLSADKLAEVKAAHEKIAELEKKIAENEAKQNEELAKHYFDQLVKETKKDVKEAAKAGKSFTDFTSDQAQKARERIAARRKEGRLNALPVNELVDHAIIGADYLAKGLKDFGEWGKAMVKDLGSAIKPFLDQIFEKAKQFHDANAKLFEKEQPTESTPENLVKKVKESGELDHKTVYDLARAHINAGVEGFENVMKAVHEDLKGALPEITQREVNDAFSEYGKVKFPSREADKIKLAEYRRLGQLVSAIEDAEKGIPPKKTGNQRPKPTLDIRQKTAELKAAMDKAGIETRSPEEQLASRNQARATALRNSIEDLDKRLKTGEKPPKGTAVPDTAEVEQLRAERDAMAAKLKEIEDAANPPPTPQEKRLAAYKKSLIRQTKDLQDRLSRSDYAPKPKTNTILDREANQLKAQREAVKQTFEEGLTKDRLAKRPWYEKMLEQISGAARLSALSGYHTLLKLASFSLARFAETPLTEAIGAGLSKIPGLRGIAARATLESGNTIKGIAKFYSKAATKGLIEAGQVLRKGKSESKLLYGRKETAPLRWYDFFGTLHMAEKTPLLTGTHEMLIARLTENALKQGLDVRDEFVRAAINKEAYDYAQRSILQEKNMFSDAVNSFHSRLEKISPETGRPETTKLVISTLIRTLLTKGIIRTPANYIAQTIARTPIGLATGVAKSIAAHARGLDNLTPAEANATYRLLKVGAVGSAFFLLGAIDATKREEDRTFGGYWEPGRKRNGKDVDWGKLRIAGKTIPHLLTHNPLTESAQMGSTMMRVAMSKYKKKDKEAQGMLTGAVTATVGLASKAPIANPLMRAGENSGSIGPELVKGLVPQLLQNIAEDTDAKERAPKTTTEALKSSVPGLRQSVPEKKAAGSTR